MIFFPKILIYCYLLREAIYELSKSGAGPIPAAVY